MAKKSFIKTVLGIGAVAVAGKLAYDKYKTVKEEFVKEENESMDSEVKKYNAMFDKKVVEVEDEEFNGCEVKSICAKTVIDLGLASFEKDVYINFTSTLSNVTIILPEGVNVVCDVDKTISGIRNLVDNIDEEEIHTVYIIGKATFSSVEVIPVNFYADDDDDFEEMLTDADGNEFKIVDEEDFEDESLECADDNCAEACEADDEACEEVSLEQVSEATAADKTEE